mgnify:CR=1 FL=1
MGRARLELLGFPRYCLGAGCTVVLVTQPQVIAKVSRIVIPSGYLHAGANTITITIRLAGGASLSHNAMYDYVRLELPGYVPPTPPSVTAYPGNGRNLVSWPV